MNLHFEKSSSIDRSAMTTRSQRDSFFVRELNSVCKYVRGPNKVDRPITSKGARFHPHQMKISR